MRWILEYADGLWFIYDTVKGRDYLGGKGFRTYAVALMQCARLNILEG